MKIFREIVHYIGVAVKLPFLVIWNPITRLAEPLRDLADYCEVTPE